MNTYCIHCNPYPSLMHLILVFLSKPLMQETFIAPWSQTVATILNPAVVTPFTISRMYLVNWTGLVLDLQKLYDSGIIQFFFIPRKINTRAWSANLSVLALPQSWKPMIMVRFLIVIYLRINGYFIPRYKANFFIFSHMFALLFEMIHNDFIYIRFQSNFVQEGSQGARRWQNEDSWG